MAVRMRAWALAAVIGTAALVSVGCGDDDDGGGGDDGGGDAAAESSGPLTEEQYLDEFCALREDIDIDIPPEDAELSEVESRAADRADRLEEAVPALEALEPPEELATAHQQMVDTGRFYLDAAQQMEEAAAAEDQARLDILLNNINDEEVYGDEAFELLDTCDAR